MYSANIANKSGGFCGRATGIILRYHFTLCQLFMDCGIAFAIIVFNSRKQNIYKYIQINHLQRETGGISARLNLQLILKSGRWDCLNRFKQIKFIFHGVLWKLNP